MKRLTILALAGVTALCATARAEDAPKKKTRGTLQAQRAGWLLGMYVGEEKNNFYPFVVQVDKKSQAFELGVRPGDEIIRFDGEETSPVWRLFNKANNIHPGRTTTMWIRRGVETYHFDLYMTKDAGLSPEEREAKEAEKNAKKKGSDKKEAKGDKDDKSGENGDGKDKKGKDKDKKGPIVIKPIPTPDGN